MIEQPCRSRYSAACERHLRVAVSYQNYFVAVSELLRRRISSSPYQNEFVAVLELDTRCRGWGEDRADVQVTIPRGVREAPFRVVLGGGVEGSGCMFSGLGFMV